MITCSNIKIYIIKQVVKEIYNKLKYCTVLIILLQKINVIRISAKNNDNYSWLMYVLFDVRIIRIICKLFNKLNNFIIN